MNIDTMRVVQAAIKVADKVDPHRFKKKGYRSKYTQKCVKELIDAVDKMLGRTPHEEQEAH